MDPTRLMTRGAVLTHREQNGPPDEYGNPTWTTTTTVVRCEIQQTSRTDATDRGPLFVEEWRAFLPPDVEIHEQDQLMPEDSGTKFEVLGPPWPARHPILRRVTHIEATLRRVG